MTVRELITLLEQQPEDALVECEYDDLAGYLDFSVDGPVKSVDAWKPSQDTDQVVITFGYEY